MWYLHIMTHTYVRCQSVCTCCWKARTWSSSIVKSQEIKNIFDGRYANSRLNKEISQQKHVLRRLCTMLITSFGFVIHWAFRSNTLSTSCEIKKAFFRVWTWVTPPSLVSLNYTWIVLFNLKSWYDCSNYIWNKKISELLNFSNYPIGEFRIQVKTFSYKTQWTKFEMYA